MKFGIAIRVADIELRSRSWTLPSKNLVHVSAFLQEVDVEENELSKAHC